MSTHLPGFSHVIRIFSCHFVLAKIRVLEHSSMLARHGLCGKCICDSYMVVPMLKANP